MTIKTEKDLKGLIEIGKVVAEAREKMIENVKAGVSTKELDIIGKRVLDKYGAVSAPEYEYGFPAANCISINDEAAHGIPSSRELHIGDSVNIDVSAVLNGYYADTGVTVVVGNDTRKNDLCRWSKRALFKGIANARTGEKINQIGKAIYNEAQKGGYSVVRNLTGHGIGRKLHEKPDYILNYYDRYDDMILNEGLVLAVESFLSTGAEFVYEDLNGWTLRTPDKSIVAQYEHTIIVRKDKPFILTT